MRKILISSTLGFFATLAAPAYAQDDAGELEQWQRDIDVAAEPLRGRDWHGFVGAGVVAAQRAHGDERAIVLPLASISYKDTAYWRTAGGGVWLFTDDQRRARIGIAGKFRRGYDPDDDAALAGMSERDTAFELGVNARFAVQAIRVSAAYYGDVTGTTDGESAILSIAHALRAGPRLRLAPSVRAEWLDADVVDYYYGVRAYEATAARPAYAGKNTVNLRAGVSGGYAVTRRWSLFAGVSHTWLGAGIADSPIVVNDEVTALYLGGGWRF